MERHLFTVSFQVGSEGIEEHEFNSFRHIEENEPEKRSENEDFHSSNVRTASPNIIPNKPCFGTVDENARQI